jgi:site-specific DNA recombinase
LCLKSLQDKRRDATVTVAMRTFPVKHGQSWPGRNDMRVNGQPERWIVAARLSRMSKRDRERGDDLINGIQTQDHRAAEWAQAEGHLIVHVTRDKNISGAIPPWERPELGPWLTDPTKLVQYDGIVAYELQRLSRGGNFDVSWLRRWAEEHGKKLYVIKERLRWPDRRDGMLWAVEAERAEQDLHDITEKITRELTALTEAGKLVGKAPFGYKVDGDKYDKRLVPTELGRKYVPLIFERVIEGWSGKRIAAWLNDERIPRENKAWFQNSIGQVIRNPVYKGFRRKQEIVPSDEVEMIIDGQVIRQPYTGPSKKIVRYRYGEIWRESPRWRYGRTLHRCEPLVDAVTWKKANDALSNRSPSGRKAVDCAMLSGALYCPVCNDGTPMYRITSGIAALRARQGKLVTREYSYYRCGGKGAGRTSCGNLVRLERVDRAVEEIITRSFGTGADGRPMEIMEHQIIYGNEAAIANRLEEIRFELQQLAAKGLPWDQEDAERAGLRAEYDRVAATEVIEDTVKLVGTGKTYLGEWETMGITERGEWLARHGFKVYASKTGVKVAKDGRFYSVAL